ncbi:uncharacterized protein BDZ99DRAFT_475780 [Mytilinidion resinicola]|uniref:Uncharacterized protein n=1 Tax=Mytilinidion resinicola TaxID=574789 RepID=A0A6A6YQ43_9PEZI|nr:uncharacterized protein BDZ99DRAFT_475780 [Mytilinidion resinicola]KAF2810910.1 hypothetical protein BDZ99DRAFT_475780 [Mytilinidion resinicola]
MDHNPDRMDAHTLSEKNTNTEDHKLSTTIAAVTDPSFPLPTLTSESSTLHYILSFGTLIGLLGAGIVGAWLFDLPLMQTASPAVVLSVSFATVLGALFFTGTVWIDWYELVLGYWWLSMPIGAAAGLAIVMNQEASAPIVETS